jgi:myo-inositol-1(or 4)-monophosphatase
MLNMMDEAILTAWNSARTGGSVLLAGYESGLLNRQNGNIEEIDYPVRAEKEIRKLIGEAFPEHRILSERSEDLDLGVHENSPLWYINALDGDFNYRRNNPLFSISIGFLSRDEKGRLRPLLGVVLAPALMEMFWATLGGGAHYCQQVPGIGLTEGPISVSDTGKVERAVVKTQIREDLKKEKADLEREGRIQSQVMSFSKEASASLNLAYVAAGRAECFYSSKLSPISAVPGSLLVTEAGGEVSDYLGRPYSDSFEILASNRLLHRSFLGLLGCHDNKRAIMC